LITFLIFTALIVGIIVVLAVRIVRRRKQAKGYTLHDVGTLIDRSLSAYRKHLVPILIASAVCLPLGSVSGFSQTFLLGFAAVIMPAAPPALLLNLLGLLGMFGVGKTLLALGVAQAMLSSSTGRAVTVSDLAPRRPGAVIGLIALLVVPSLATAFLGIIGALIALLWALAPAALVFEELGPWAALKRSARIVRAHYSGLLNTLVPLWLIGWLVVGTLLFGSLFVLRLLVPLPPTLSAQLLLGGWMVGNIFVAPLTAFGTLSFYLSARDRLPVLELADLAVPAQVDRLPEA
jgi:hypothetical protein